MILFIKKVILCAFTMVLLSFCTWLHQDNSNDLSLNESPCSEELDEGYEVVEEEKYYRIAKCDNGYYYDIFAENKDVVKSDGPLHKPPNISMPDDHTVKFTFQSGTGISTQWGFFYNVEKDVFSRTFYGIYDECNELVAHRNKNAIVVRNIYDKTKYYKEILSFSYPLAVSTEPFTEVKFVENGKRIKVTYLYGDNYSEMTEYFDI